MNLKKLMAVILTLIMITASFSGCGNESGNTPVLVSKDQTADKSDVPTDTSSEKLPLLQIDGKEIDTDGLIIMTVNGVDVPFDEWRYWYKTIDTSYYSGGDDNYWNDFSDQFQDLLTIVKQQILESYWSILIANDYNISLTEQDEADIETYLQQQGDAFETTEEYEKALEESSITEDLLRRLITQQVTGNRDYEELYNKDGALLAPPDDEIKEDLAKDYARVYHVLVANDHFSDDEEYADADEQTLKNAAKEYAEELLEQIQNGADIYDLAQEADDPGMVDNTDGYFFTYGEMVEPFEKAAFELEIGQTSDLVETDYGYHIIQRLEQEQYVEDNWDEVRTTYLNRKFNEQIDELLNNVTIEYWEDYDKIVPGSVH